jgi:hypothetical protein
MRPAFTRGIVAVTLVPLLMAEFPSLLRLVFAEFRLSPYIMSSLS